MANLTQLKMLEGLNGFLLVDKPEGIAFTTVVKSVKRVFNLIKVGHGGSLDAMASGLLVLLIGDANKYVGEVMGADRSYTGTMRLGLTTDTHDIYGNRLAELPVAPEALASDRLDAAIREVKGDIFQTEPRFCSVRREGSALYEIADTGEHSQFMAHVYRLEVKPVVAGNDAEFELMASKGVLVRTLVNDFGSALGCGATLASLRRTKVGRFSVADAIPFAQLLKTEIKDFASCVLPLSAALR